MVFGVALDSEVVPIFCGFSNFLKIVRKLTKVSIVFKEFETILVNMHVQFCSAADPLGRMMLFCLTISQSNCEEAGQDE